MVTSSVSGAAVRLGDAVGRGRVSLRLVAVFAVISSSFVGWSLSPAAHADPLCELAATSGTVSGTSHWGTCVPFPYGTICDYETGGADPQVVVATEVCVPAPIITTSSR